MRQSSVVGLDVTEVNIYLGHVGDNPMIIKGFLDVLGRLALGDRYC